MPTETQSSWMERTNRTPQTIIAAIFRIRKLLDELKEETKVLSTTRLGILATAVKAVETDIMVLENEANEPVQIQFPDDRKYELKKGIAIISRRAIIGLIAVLKEKIRTETINKHGLSNELAERMVMFLACLGFEFYCTLGKEDTLIARKTHFETERYLPISTFLINLLSSWADKEEAILQAQLSDYDEVMTVDTDSLFTDPEDGAIGH